MCMEDLWIARHTQSRFVASAGSHTLTANPDRLGLIFSGSQSFDVLSNGVNTFFSVRMPQIPTSWSFTDTNEVPPTDNTGTITQATTASFRGQWIALTKDYGSLLLGPITVTAIDGNVSLWELVPDQALSELLNQMEYNKGWPIYRLPPPNQVPNA
jgi:hypothetical protein